MHSMSRRPSFFEFLMAAALLALVFLFVAPRVLQGSPEVRASQATALSLQLDQLYARWRSLGGTHGAGEPCEPALLTRNLLECFTSTLNAPYSSSPISSGNLGPSGVYEKPSLSPSPSALRLKGFLHARLRTGTLPSPNSHARPGVLLAGTFGVFFNGQRWAVWPSH